MTKPDNIILEGVVGSTAYGLATPSSDVDIKGVYVAPIREVLGLRGPQAVSETKDHTDPDWSYHEVGKFVSLALKCNPTILEILYLDEYEKRTSAGRSIVYARQHFLSEPAIRGAYGAYARAQADRLIRRNADGKPWQSGEDADIEVISARTEKHARHTMRLLLQGAQLLRSKGMSVNVGMHRDWIFEMGYLAGKSPKEFYREYERQAAIFDSIESTLPKEPNRAIANELLVSLRLEVARL